MNKNKFSEMLFSFGAIRYYCNFSSKNFDGLKKARPKTHAVKKYISIFEETFCLGGNPRKYY
jgi:hypothetical protein